MKKLLTGITAFALVITSAFTSYALAFDAGSGTTADSAVITEEDYARGESHSYNGFLYYSCYGENDIIGIGETKTIVLHGPPDAVGVWSSSNPSCISVDANGNITGVSKGSARITCNFEYIDVKMYDYMTIECVEVKTGIYKIHNSSENGYLTIDRNNINSGVVPVGAPKITGNPSNTTGQMWRIQYMGNQMYSIRPYLMMDFCLRGEGPALVDIKDYGTAGLNNATNTLSEQAQWWIEKSNTGNGYYLSNSDMDLMVEDTIYLQGNAAGVLSFAQNGQEWALEEVTDAPTGINFYDTESGKNDTESSYPLTVLMDTSKTYRLSDLGLRPTIYGLCDLTELHSFEWNGSATAFSINKYTGKITPITLGSDMITCKATTAWITVNKAVIISIVPFESCDVIIQNSNSKKSLDIQDITVSGSAAIINTSDLDDSQRWHLELLRDGGYYITSVKTGRYLTAPNTPMPEQSITVKDSEPSTEGIWSFERIDTGNPDEYRYKLLPRHAAGHLSLNANSTDEGASLVEGNYNAEKSTWQIYTVSDYSMYLRGYEDGDTNMPPILSACQNSMKTNAGLSGWGSTGATKAEVMLNLTTTRMAFFLTHGNYAAVQLNATENLTTSDLQSLGNSLFTNLKFVFYGACSTGSGGASYNQNLINVTGSKGVDCVVGYRGSIMVSECNAFYAPFVEELSNGSTVEEALAVGHEVALENAAENGRTPSMKLSTLCYYGDLTVKPCA